MEYAIKKTKTLESTERFALFLRCLYYPNVISKIINTDYFVMIATAQGTRPRISSVSIFR